MGIQRDLVYALVRRLTVKVACLPELIAKVLFTAVAAIYIYVVILTLPWQLHSGRMVAVKGSRRRAFMIGYGAWALMFMAMLLERML